MTIKAITFDIDDTLWDNAPVMARLEPAHYQWLDEQIHHAQRVPLDEYMRRRQDFSEAHPDVRGDHTEVRRRVLHQIVREQGIEEPLATQLTERAIHYMLALRHQIEPYEESEALLETLSKRYPLAVITNGNVDMRRLPLGRHFDAIFNAGELGMSKPSPKVFHAALAALGDDIRPEDAIHVGDSWAHDALAAHGAGMKAAWIDVHDQHHECPEGVYRLNHVRELPALLAQLNGDA
ncbi:HAD family hydrolase [Zymobacter sp. IVIA_5232.4 C2]|uniref:HAD family hydrolase n=1 Tax=Zymobacter sp. IVIA_5232.4 C2 TaxID=3394855 RepID=UPI0039C26DB1